MKFLTSDWFKKVAELRAAAGDLNLPPQISDTVINVSLTDAGDDVAPDLHIKGGDFYPGHHDAPTVTLTLTQTILRKVFLDLDAQAGMQAFFAGEIKAEGDVTKMMELAGYQPSDVQKQLLDDIRANTE